VLRADPSIDLRALHDLLVAEYGADASTALEFVPVGGDSWCFRADDLWVSVRRDRAGHERAGYEAARALADDGADFLLAPVRRRGGRVVHEVGGRPVVVLPHLEVVPVFADRVDDLVGVVSRLHACTRPGALEAETFDIFYEDELRAALAAADAGTVAGPFSARTLELVRRERTRIDAAHSRLRELQAECRSLDRDEFVVTHGEPDGNALETADGRVLLGDVGTLLLGPPERDLWSFDVGNRCRVRDDVVAFYRRWFALGEVAEYVDRFMQPHPGDAADADKWHWLVEFTGRLDEW
jgi:spectinomycin phosphotransferase